jgi:hypothetical protein
VGPPAESFRPEKEPEFERHIEARQTRVRVRLGLGNVVDGIGAPTDDSADLLKPDFPAIIGFAGATRREAGAHDSKDDSLEMVLIVSGERTVYENVSPAHPEERAARTLEIAASSSETVKCVARPFGLRMRTPSNVVPKTFDAFRLATLDPFRLTAFDALRLATFAVTFITTPFGCA